VAGQLELDLGLGKARRVRGPEIASSRILRIRIARPGCESPTEGWHAGVQDLEASVRRDRLGA
jgi:hypothetical protein